MLTKCNVIPILFIPVPGIKVNAFGFASWPALELSKDWNGGTFNPLL